MDPLYDLGLEAIQWLQATYPGLTSFLALVSEFGSLEFYLALIPLIYWCINKSFGRQVTYLMILSYTLNSVLKHALREPRPYWLNDEVGLAASAEYGLPSGHTQIGATVYLYLAYWVRQRWAWLLAVLLIFLMAVSRVYLGVHFVHDVVAGVLLAALVLVAFWLWDRNFRVAFRNRILGQRLLAAILVPGAFGLVYLLLRLLLGDAPESVSWALYVDPAEVQSLEHIASSLGMLLGIGMGFVLEASRVHFTVAGSIIKRVLRYLLGIVVTLAIWRGLSLILPEEPLWLGFPLRFIRYWLAGLWVAYYAPLIFVRLRLAEASPRPEVELQVSEGSIMRG